jgi:glutaredoxin
MEKLLYFIFIVCAFIISTDAFASSHPSTYVAAKRSEKKQLTLYMSPSCPYCQKVMRYLDKIGKTVPMKNTQSDAEARKELKNIGGKSQVPCLFIDGKALYESDAIIDWLCKHKDLLSIR